MNLDLDVSGDERALRRLLRIAHGAESPRPFMDRVARLFLRETKGRWAASPWAPLDPDTVRRKARQGQDPRVLRATGALERALTVWRAPGQQLKIKPFELVFGLRHGGTAYYGRFHQQGRGVPRREILSITPQMVRRVHQALRDFLLD